MAELLELLLGAVSWWNFWFMEHIIQCWISQFLLILAVYFDTCRWYFVVRVCWWSNLYW